MTPEDEIRDFIVACKPEHSGLTHDRPLITDGILDSLTIYRVAAFLRESWDVEVRDEDLVAANFGTVRAIAGLAERRRADTTTE